MFYRRFRKNEEDQDWFDEFVVHLQQIRKDLADGVEQVSEELGIFDSPAASDDLYYSELSDFIKKTEDLLGEAESVDNELAKYEDYDYAYSAFASMKRRMRKVDYDEEDDDYYDDYDEEDDDYEDENDVDWEHYALSIDSMSEGVDLIRESIAGIPEYFDVWGDIGGMLELEILYWNGEYYNRLRRHIYAHL